jgi:quinol monooxygenase YgiN
MLIQSIHFTFAPEDADKAEGFLRELRDESRKEDGVISFDIGRSKDKPNVFALWEEYRDKAALDTHIATEHFQRLVIHGVRVMAEQRYAETVFPIS